MCQNVPHRACNPAAALPAQPEESPSLWKETPFPLPRQWGEVVFNNIWVLAMFPRDYCRNLTLSCLEPEQLFKKTNKQKKLGHWTIGLKFKQKSNWYLKNDRKYGVAIL